MGVVSDKIKKVLIYIGITLVLCVAAFLSGYYTSATANAREIATIRNEHAQQNRIITSRIAESQESIKQLKQRNIELTELYNGIGDGLNGVEQDTRARIKILESLLNKKTN